MRLPERLPDWACWALVLPAAAGAWVAVQIVMTVFGNFLTEGLRLWNLGSWFVKIGAIAAAPYCFVWAVAKRAPRHSFTVAIVLAVFHATATTAVLVSATDLGRLGGPRLLIIAAHTAGIIGSIAACAQFRKKKPTIIDIPLPS